VTNDVPLPSGPPPGIDERTYWADRVWRPWVDDVFPLREATVLEYGCGPGSVSRAFAPYAGRYIGLDIDVDAVAVAQQGARQEGHDRAEFHAHPAEEIVDAFASYAGEVDVVLLYAVVEHLTVEERISVLRAARQIARPAGIVAVVELPNRLSPLDWHSSFLPFINQLPDELALDYLREAHRPELRDYVLKLRDETLPARDDAAALLALRRFGRGGSYHEFELAWGEPISGHALATNWEPHVIPHRDFHPGELGLARAMARHCPELEPSWSRQWIDVILSPDKPARRGPFHHPWIGAAGPGSRLASTNLVDDVIFLPSGDARLHVELPEATTQIALRIVDGESLTRVEVETLAGELVEIEVAGRPGESVTAVVDLPGFSDDLLVRLVRGGWVIGLTYRGYGRRSTV
jgi:SAM-dependent methyltransferase